MFRPPVEVEYIDPGMVFKHMPEVHAQDDIVAEQEDLCMGIPVMQPFRPGDQEHGLSGTGNSVNNPVPLANLPGIVLLPAVEDHQVEALLHVALRKRSRGERGEHDLRVDDGPEHVHLLVGEPGDRPERIKKPHERIAYLIGGCILKRYQFVPEEGVVGFENFRKILILTP